MFFGEKTYHFEIFWPALCAVEMAGKQHVLDVVTCAVIEFPHVEGSWLEVVEVSFDFQALHDTFLHEMYVPDLIPGKTDQQ